MIAFLAVEKYSAPFKTINELAAQTEYKIGTLGGSVYVNILSVSKNSASMLLDSAIYKSSHESLCIYSLICIFSIIDTIYYH